ncbi:MAG: hypothetical protein AB8B84_15850 [Granulosicoccus sp.]
MTMKPSNARYDWQLPWRFVACRCVSCKVSRVLSLSLALAFSACFSALAYAENHAIVVTGLGGDAHYSEQFSNTGTVVYDSLQTLDVDADRVVFLDETATKNDILKAINDVYPRIEEPSVAVFYLFLIGHGNADSEGWRFNVAGPDLTTADIVAALNPLSSVQQLIVLASSASGAALEILSQPGRVVVTATKSGGEINAVRFPEYLAEALRSPQSDIDRNEILTIAEAFRYAESRTVEYYEQQNLLAPEHARLRGDNATDIPLALLGSLKDASKEPEVAALLAERLVLESRFKTLKEAKPSMSKPDYYQELEVLLLEIARLQQSIDFATGWSENDAGS